MSARHNIYFKSSILDTMVRSRPKDNFSNLVEVGSQRSAVAYGSPNLTYLSAGSR